MRKTREEQPETREEQETHEEQETDSKKRARDLRCDVGHLGEAGRDRDGKILREVGRNQGFDIEFGDQYSLSPRKTCVCARHKVLGEMVRIILCKRLSVIASE